MNEAILKFFDKSKSKAVVSLVFFAILLIIPVILRMSSYKNESYLEGVLILCMMWAAMTLSWNLLMGYMGIWSLAQQVFFGIAAYTSAMMNYYLHMSPWAGFIIGPLCATFVGLLVAIPVLRLKAAPYIIIATMCLAEIVRLIFTNLVHWTRGELGFWQMDPFSNILSINFNGADKIPYYYLIFIIFAAITLVCALLAKSPTGLAMKAIRDSQEAAESLGVDIVKTKIKVFLISAYMAGLCGVFFAHYIKILTPTDVFGQGMMTEFIAMNVFGGIATIRGPIFGSFLITIIMETLQGIDDYKLLIYALILIITTLILPNGILNSKPQFIRWGNKIKNLRLNKHVKITEVSESAVHLTE
jgi:ABC-type branched-chain amino acid transport system, permease component